MLPCCVPVKLRRCPSTLCPSFPAGAALLHPMSSSAPTLWRGKENGLVETSAHVRGQKQGQGAPRGPAGIVLLKRECSVTPSHRFATFSAAQRLLFLCLGKFYFSWAVCELVSRKRHPCKQSFVCLESFWYCLTSFNTDAPNSRMAF